LRGAPTGFRAMSWFGGGGDASGTYDAINASGETMQMEMTPALKALGETDRLYIKQRMAKCEVLTCNCFESKNKYDVYSGSSVVFHAHETTSCCLRQLQTPCPECAGWDIDIDYVGPGSNQDGAFRMTKACTPCTFLCINRPVTYIYDHSGTELGSIRDPCALIPANMTFSVQDENREELLRAESGCCQWGICCPLPCGPCRTVEFPIVDKDGSNVGELQKSMKGCIKMCCCSFCFDDMENYKVDMGGVKDLRSRALLMSLAIFTDFRYFNNTTVDEVTD